MSLTVVGSIAYDAVKTPSGERERMLGGAATHFSLAASLFVPVRPVGPVGPVGPSPVGSSTGTGLGEPTSDLIQGEPTSETGKAADEAAKTAGDRGKAASEAKQAAASEAGKASTDAGKTASDATKAASDAIAAPIP